MKVGGEIEALLMLCLRTKIFDESQVRAVWVEYRRCTGRSLMSLHQELQEEFEERSRAWKL